MTRLRNPHRTALETLTRDYADLGARLAVHEDVSFDRGQQILLSARPQILGRDFHLALHCHVTGPVTPQDPKHPQVKFNGVTFGELSDNEFFILHSCVQSGVAMETDTLSQVLLLHSREVEDHAYVHCNAASSSPIADNLASSHAIGLLCSLEHG